LLNNKKMAKGYEKHKERLDAINALGRELTRRSSSKCELCGDSGVKLSGHEIVPLPEQPDADHTVFICEACRDGLTGGKLDADRWRFLENVIWSDVPVVQVAAVRITRKLLEQGVLWAADLLDNVYLSPEVEEWV
jgi:protein PhnA